MLLTRQHIVVYASTTGHRDGQDRGVHPRRRPGCQGDGQSRDLFGLDRGDKVKLTGTAKGYGEYKDQVHTIVQRVKVEVVEAAA